MEAATDQPRVWQIAHGDEIPTTAQTESFQRLCQKRHAGQPLAYLTGTREFYSRSFEVNKHVLIPRAESEELVAWAIKHAPAQSRLLELGTGSGALAVTIALERPDLQVNATDLSEGALIVAQNNAQALGAQVQFYQGDWFAAIAPNQMFDTIISNPPYIAADDEHLQQGDLPYEPELALASGPDGLNAIRIIIEQAPAWLTPGGLLMLEHGWNQAQAVRRLLARQGLERVYSIADDQGHWRVSGAQTLKDTRLIDHSTAQSVK